MKNNKTNIKKSGKAKISSFINKSIRLAGSRGAFQIDEKSKGMNSGNYDEATEADSRQKNSDAKKVGSANFGGDEDQIARGSRKKAESKKSAKKSKKDKDGSARRIGQKIGKKLRELPVLGKVLQNIDSRLTKRRENRKARRIERREKFQGMSIFQKGFFVSSKVVSVILLIVSIYLIVAPFAPELDFRLRQWFGFGLFGERGTRDEIIAEVMGEQEDASDSKDGSSNLEESDPEDLIPSGNRLIIPSIGVDVPIVEGDDEDALSRGVWRRPNTSTPDDGGNTVITGHRFQYKPPNNKTFYNLDKVQLDDSVVVYWKGQKLSYRVTSIFEVEPDQIEIEHDTDRSILTLYTCTPLWTAKKRLVVVAEPV